MVIVFKYGKNQRTSQRVWQPLQGESYSYQRERLSKLLALRKCQLCKESWNQTLRMRSKLWESKSSKIAGWKRGGDRMKSYEQGFQIAGRRPECPPHTVYLRGLPGYLKLWHVWIVQSFGFLVEDGRQNCNGGRLGGPVRSVRQGYRWSAKSHNDGCPELWPQCWQELPLFQTQGLESCVSNLFGLLLNSKTSELCSIELAVWRKTLYHRTALTQLGALLMVRFYLGHIRAGVLYNPSKNSPAWTKALFNAR